MSARERMGID